MKNNIKIGVWDGHKYLVEVVKKVEKKVYCRILKSMHNDGTNYGGTFILDMNEKGRLLLEPTKKMVRQAEILIQKSVEEQI